MNDHDRWADAAGAYLLQALEDSERDRYEAHMTACAVCQEDVELLRVASDALPMAVEQLDAPPALKDRIMNVVNAEAELLRAAGPEADRAPAPAADRRRWWHVVPPRALAFGAAMLLVVGGVAGFQAAQDGDAPVGPTTRTVLAKVTAPGAPDASARLVMRGESAQLVTQRLPRPGRNRVYQVWLMRAGATEPEPTDALFTVRHDGSASVDVPGSLEGVEQVLVTSEPEGGSQKPSRAPVISAIPA